MRAEAPLIVFFLAGALMAQSSAPVDAKVEFNFQIRPLLSDRCFPCHGPDAKTRMAGLRLDRKEEAFKVAKSGLQVIHPGNPARSEMVRRILSKDPAVQMPPSWSTLSLTGDEADLIRRWVEQGAEYKPHWSFIPPAAAQIPEVRGTRRLQNPIDRFVQARLEKEGLSLAREASPETLIRRLSLGLLGLPPTPEEIDAFVADRSAGAYEKLVNRLLASPHYGERMACDWLDLARFADTYGYQNDVERDMSPWRDWVIRSFNENLRYDQFITWQIAGDLLPAATPDQRLATAFNRLHRQTNEGGSIDEEFRTEYVADRLHTIGTGVLGLTIECARCHDHKYDPISQREYYRLFAFFNNIDESGLYSHFTQAVPSPALLLYRAGEAARHRELKRKIEHAEKHLAAIDASAQPRFETWLKTRSGVTNLPSPGSAFRFDEVTDQKTPNSTPAGDPALLLDGAEIPDARKAREIEPGDMPALVEGRRGRALRFSGDNAVVCKGSGNFGRAQPFTFSLWLRPSARQPRAVVFHRSRAWTDSGSRGYELILEDGRPVFGLIHFWPGNALVVRARDPLPSGEWSHLAVGYDGSSRAAGLRLYLNGKPLILDAVRDTLFKDIVHRKEWGDMDVDKVELTLGGRFRDAGFKDGLIDEFQVFDRALTPVEVRILAGLDGPASRDELFAYYLARHDPEHAKADEELRRLREQGNALVNGVPEIMVMQEMKQRRPTYLLARGRYDAPGPRVEPGTPEHVLPFHDGLPKNRLGLARWLVDPRNPLTARVAVNRIWKLHFGRGLVGTPEDFGSQGELPTHPQLLDWLAQWFVENKCDVKALHRLILTSATYRQDSEASRSLVARDPANLLLARGLRYRLTAEEIRDSALAASGLLVRRIGGPSVKPYQPAGLWEESGTHKTYVQDKGEKLYRRSMYTFWKRTMPPPSMITFDAPSREYCAAKREPTATPLQALVLLNDPQFVEASRILAERLMRKHGADLDSLISDASRHLIGRRPDDQEIDILRRLYREQLAYFLKNPAAAEKYLATGEHSRDASLPAVEAAAAAVLANTLMNHDEFVMNR